MTITKHVKTAAVVSAIVITAANAAGPVTQYGRLTRDGNRIVGEKTNGGAVQLKGVSTQWSSAGWGSDRFFRADMVGAMVDGWDAQVIRASMGIAFDKRSDDNPSHRVADGYNVDPAGNWGRVKTVIDAAIANDVYVIIDWHSHTAHDSAETELAIDFFTNPELAGQYGNHPAVIFEIYNEPEDDATWDDVKVYANTVIGALRAKGFDNLVLIGNPYWTSQPHLVKDEDIDDGNFAAAFHFYAESHRVGRTHWFSPRPSGNTYRSAVQDALDGGVPVFVTEWGTNDASTNEPLNFAEADKWHAYLDSNSISSCAWGVMAGSGNVLYFWTAAGDPLASADPANAANWTNPARMTPHGRYVYRWLTGKDTTVIPESDYPEYTGARELIPLPARSVWNTLSDVYNNGASEVSLVLIDGGATAHITYKLDKGEYEWNPYIGASFGADVQACGYGVGYSYKGGAHTLRAEQEDVLDYAYHTNSRPTPDAEDWVTVDIPWTHFLQPSWGASVAQDRAQVRNITWYVEAPSGSGEIWVKDVYCLQEAGAISVRPNRRPTPSANTRQSYIRIKGQTVNIRMEQAGRIDIFDMKGKQLRTVKLTSGNHTIRMNDLPKGMYIIRAGSGQSWKRAVKMLVR